MSEKNGGPAFPCVYVKHAPGEVGNNVAIKEYGEGATMRDYFAVNAPARPESFSRKESLQDQVIEIRGGQKRVETRLVAEPIAETCARWAYVYADAMLKARTK